MARISAYSLSQEPDEVMATYVRFMERAGVSELIMFFDGPISPAVAEMIRARRDGPMRIRAEALDEAYWHAALDGEVTMARKFTHAIRRAHEMMEGDWLWVADPDEYPEEPATMFAALDGLPPSVEAVSVPPAEAVWGPDEGDAPPFATRAFRVATPPGGLVWGVAKRLIYGRWHVFFDRNMLSHKAGKQFVRRGVRADYIDSHRTVRDGAPINRPLDEVADLPRVLHVRHYDAVSYDRWLFKMRRGAERGAKARSSTRPGRLAQVELVRGLLTEMQAAPDAEAARRIGERAFRRLYHVTAWQARLLRAIGGHVRLDPVVGPEAG